MKTEPKGRARLFFEWINSQPIKDIILGAVAFFLIIELVLMIGMIVHLTIIPIELYTGRKLEGIEAPQALIGALGLILWIYICYWFSSYGSMDE